jgi:hypothetical protein
MTSPEVPLDRLDDDYYFHLRYPTLKEMLREGGEPGRYYLLVPGHMIGKVGKKTGPDGTFYQEVRDLQTMTVAGPKGTCDSAKLMVCGHKIPGAAAGCMKIPFMVVPELVEITGIPDPWQEELDRLKLTRTTSKATLERLHSPMNGEQKRGPKPAPEPEPTSASTEGTQS